MNHSVVISLTILLFICILFVFSICFILFFVYHAFGNISTFFIHLCQIFFRIIDILELVVKITDGQFHKHSIKCYFSCYFLGDIKLG